MLAQQVEHLPFKQRVPGSNPGQITAKLLHRGAFSFVANNQIVTTSNKTPSQLTASRLQHQFFLSYGFSAVYNQRKINPSHL